jgi:general secretion pathway protein C
MRHPITVSPAVLESFDPFFRRNEQAGSGVVTSLNLKLFGVREDRASGRGSAIIATSNGKQRSFVMGEEIIPGVTLVSVDFDSVTIEHGGTHEQIFLDQSPPAEIVQPETQAPDGSAEPETASEGNSQ